LYTTNASDASEAKVASDTRDKTQEQKQCRTLAYRRYVTPLLTDRQTDRH